LASSDDEEACECLKELKADVGKAIESLYMAVLEKKERDRNLIKALMRRACKTEVVKEGDVAPALCALLELVPDMAMDVPMVGKIVAEWIADLVGARHVHLERLTKGFEALAAEGEAAKLAAQVMVAVKEEHGEAVAVQLWTTSGLDLQAWLREGERTEEHLLEFAANQKVEFLFPLMACKKYLQQAFSSGEEAAAVTAWLRSNLSNELLMSGGCARAIMRALLKNFGGADKKLHADLGKYGAICAGLYGAETEEQMKLQLHLLYEVQLFCYESGFADGMLKRLFHAIYDFDMVLEETFNMWREDTDMSTPGKKHAVLHANQFLQWLAEAEEEEDEDDDEA